jgi:hypothetical protein
MPDITRNRHRGNPASVAAYERSLFTHENDEERVYLHIILVTGPSVGRDGVTSKEVAAALGKPLNAISGRLTSLKMKGKIRGTGVRRDGAEVLVACAEMEKTA